MTSSPPGFHGPGTERNPDAPCAPLQYNIIFPPSFNPRPCKDQPVPPVLVRPGRFVVYPGTVRMCLVRLLAPVLLAAKTLTQFPPCFFRASFQLRGNWRGIYLRSRGFVLATSTHFRPLLSHGLDAPFEVQLILGAPKKKGN